MSRFETPDMALRRAQILAQRETQKQRGWAQKVRQMRQRMQQRPSPPTPDQQLSQSRQWGGRLSPSLRTPTDPPIDPNMRLDTTQINDLRRVREEQGERPVKFEDGSYGLPFTGMPFAGSSRRREQPDISSERQMRAERKPVGVAEQNRIVQRYASALSPAAQRDFWEKNTPAQQLQIAQGFGKGGITAPSDIGSPAGEAVFPGVVGKIPGLRTPAEAASTIGTAGMGSLPMAAKSGALALGLGGAFGGGELADVAGAPRWVGELGGGLAGGLAGGSAGPMYARRAGEVIESAGGIGRMAASEAGGTRIPRGAPKEVSPTNGVPDAFSEARTTLLTSMKIQRKNIKLTSAERAAERGNRLVASENAYEQALKEGKSPQEAFSIKRGMQAGELPRVAGVETALQPQQEKAILDRIATHNFGRGTGADFERDRARGALFSLSVGEPIQENEIVTLQKVLGPDFAKQLRQHAKKTAGGLYNLPYELAVTPKAILSSADMSYPLRQGVMLAPGHPVEFSKAWVPMVRSFGSEDAAQAVNRSLIEDPTVINLADGNTITIGRARQDFNVLRTLDPSLTTSEEAFRGSLAEKIPGIGHMVRASNRAFTTFGNKFRGDVFGTIVKGWQRDGVPITEDRLQNLSNMLNRFSGRGTLGDSRITNLLQATWWAPQTRVAPAQAAGQLFSTDRAVRAEAWRNMASFLGTGMAIMGAAHLSGAKVGIDPRDTDFGKIQIGKIHVNIWGPSQVLTRTMARIVSGQRIDINRGVVPTDRIKEAVRYFRSGLAPEWAIIWDAAAKENMRGQALDLNFDTFKRELPDRILPLAIQDMYEAIKEEGAVGALVGPATFFGESVSTYGPTVKQQADEIGQFKGLSIEEHEQIRDFYDKVDQWRNEQEEEFGEADSTYERSIERVAEQEKFDPTLTEWAKVLRNKSMTERNRNPEYDQFILDHWDEVKRDAPYLITDRLRKMHATGPEPAQR